MLEVSNEVAIDERWLRGLRGLAVDRSGLPKVRVGSPWLGLGRGGAGQAWLGSARCAGRLACVPSRTWLGALGLDGVAWRALA